MVVVCEEGIELSPRLRDDSLDTGGLSSSVISLTVGVLLAAIK